MPLFDFHCNLCGCNFELLVSGKDEAICPKCNGKDVIKKFSVFSFSGSKGFSSSLGSSCSSCTSSSCSSCGK